MLTPKEMWGAERCGVCYEKLKITDSDVAEMVLEPHAYVGTGERCRQCDLTANHILHTDETGGKHHIVHYMCGQGRGMVLA